MKKYLGTFLLVALLMGSAVSPPPAKAYWAWGKKRFIFWCDLAAPDNECKRWIDNDPSN